MIVLLDTPTDLDEAQRELGCPVEQLLTPLTRRKRQHPGAPFAIDNGAFANFDPAGFTRLLSKHADAIAQCRFVAVPDVVGSAIRTLEVWKHWAPIPATEPDLRDIPTCGKQSTTTPPARNFYDLGRRNRRTAI